MTERVPAGDVVADIIACEQYRFRVSLPSSVKDAERAEITRRSIRETTAIFLECTRRYQDLAWEGAANISFTDSRVSPSDSKSEFLHLLATLRMIELSLDHHRKNRSMGDGREYLVTVSTPLPRVARDGLEKRCASLGLRLRFTPAGAGKFRGRPRIGGTYRAARRLENPFSYQPVQGLEGFRATASLRLARCPAARWCAAGLLGMTIVFLRLLPIVSRVVFSLWYRIAAARILKRLDRTKNLFVYFDLRLGRNRDPATYQRWKYGDALVSGTGTSPTPILFSHLARPGHAYGFDAMRWAHRALKRMESEPAAGCVIVSYLIPLPRLLKLAFQRRNARRHKRRRLAALRQDSGDLTARHIYGEFITVLERTNAFAMEVSAGYEEFFSLMSPGVVIQADAVAKTARHFTASARRRGSRVIYVADRICTHLRTSNQLISGSGDNPHFPNRFVVFDRITRDEFVRQGIPGSHIHHYQRHCAAGRNPAAPRPGRKQAVIFLQAYEDNIGAMIRLGADLVRQLPAIEIIYQEHPNFPVCERAKAGLLDECPSGLRFLAPGESPDYGRAVALITGYSTAPVPGILLGIPLIWLRRQIENSMFCEELLDRIGFAADDSGGVKSLLTGLLDGDRTMREACLVKKAAARSIFGPESGEGRNFAEILALAVTLSFSEIP